jgi:hypothetical protein
MVESDLIRSQPPSATRGAGVAPPREVNRRRESHRGARPPFESHRRRNYRNRRRHSFVPVEVDVVSADQATGLGSSRKVTGELGQPRPPRWVVPLFGLGALVLVPWVALLVLVLPSAHRAAHWDVAWAGFDVALALLLLAVAAAAWRRSPWFEGAATAAATLLFVDAWFDVLTSSTQAELVVALVEAAFVEVPLAIICLLLARDAERRLPRPWVDRAESSPSRSGLVPGQPTSTEAAIRRQTCSDMPR